ncbi:hypothetical protein HBI73_121990 [Parastagonospora nodorum]|nr:hypothetical protein HBI73_121990 [Parastagonospora nodorum]
MFKLVVASLASAWLASAQETDNDVYHPHAAFALVRTGERTPTIRRGNPVLTALGAQQMFLLGQNFRTRYITGNAPDGLGVQHISGMSTDALNNDQISVQTSSQQHVISSAQAFMQGLYPPRNIANSNGTGSSTGLLSNGSAIDFPLGGYQYASIQSSSHVDSDSVFVSGNQNCPTAQQAAMMYYTTSNFYNTKTATDDFYDKLNLDWFEGNLMPEQLNYINAIEINDYLQYQYNHNSSIYRALANDSSFAGVYDEVRTLADEHAWYRYGNTSSPAIDADNQAIGGKTLAASILNTFQLLVADRLGPGDPNDISSPLTFLFSEPESFISLISIMMADYRDNYFRSIPPFASALIFELFSTGENNTFPTTKDDLWVRFYFQNGTNFDANQLTAFPIFGNGPSRTDMQWRDFEDLFSRVKINTLQDWCTSCNSPALFCWGVDDTSVLPPIRQRHNAITPAIGGVIGAIVTLAVAGLLFALAMLLGGVRLHRVPRNKKSELGGFKGSAKLASDPDLSLAKNGAMPAGISFVPEGKRGHERVGSWELRQKEFGVEREGRESLEGIDGVASKPVQPSEHV